MLTQTLSREDGRYAIMHTVSRRGSQPGEVPATGRSVLLALLSRGTLRDDVARNRTPPTKYVVSRRGRDSGVHRAQPPPFREGADARRLRVRFRLARRAISLECSCHRVTSEVHTVGRPLLRPWCGYTWRVRYVTGIPHSTGQGASPLRHRMLVS